MHFFGTMHKKVEKIVLDIKRLYKAKNGQFFQNTFFSRTQERKRFIQKMALFKAFKTFSKFQLYTSKQL